MARGIGEVLLPPSSCKTLTKAELTAIESAGLSVFVVFQHCGHSARTSIWQNKETADKGRKDAEGRGASGAASSASPPRRRSISPSISIRTPAGTTRFPPPASGRASKPISIRSTEVFAQYILAGRRLWRRDHLPASEGERQGEILLAVDRRSAMSDRRSSSTAGNGICFRMSSRSSGATRATRSTPTWPIRRRRISGNGRHAAQRAA